MTLILFLRFFNFSFFGCSAWLADLRSPARDRTAAMAVKAWNPKHYTTRELDAVDL